MLPIHERFLTWQGEGVHLGRRAFFIRTFGCPQHCPWCDSAGTWHKLWVPSHINRMTEVELVDEVLASNAEVVVITGGEPAVHDLRELTQGLKSHSIRVHLETSGAYPLQGQFDWITVSPKDKWAKPALPDVMYQANEIKLIIEDPSDLDWWFNKILVMWTARCSLFPTIWLHPEWSKRNDPAVLNAITEWVKKYGDPFRAGYQLHKLFKADALDNRSAPLVPLGGDPAKGF